MPCVLSAAAPCQYSPFPVSVQRKHDLLHLKSSPPRSGLGNELSRAGRVQPRPAPHQKASSVGVLQIYETSREGRVQPRSPLHQNASLVLILRANFLARKGFNQAHPRSSTIGFHSLLAVETSLCTGGSCPYLSRRHLYIRVPRRCRSSCAQTVSPRGQRCLGYGPTSKRPNQTSKKMVVKNVGDAKKNWEKLMK